VTIALLFISDGRTEYRERALASAKEMLPEPDHFKEIDDAEHKLGFGGAIQAGWRRILTETDAEFVFHLEQDFTFNWRVPIFEMAAVLRAQPHLVQLALRRQPWNEEEKAAGGVVELHADDFTEAGLNGWRWLEHQRYFTTNPSLYRRELCEYGYEYGTFDGKTGRDFSEAKNGSSSICRFVAPQIPGRQSSTKRSGQAWRRSI